jgi:hypothetical protein
VLLLLPIAAWGFARTGPLVESASEATSSNSTFAWRTTGWGELISSHDSTSQLAVGDPAGGGSFDRVIGGHPVNVSAHNDFIDAYIRFGLPGVLVLCWLGLLLWFRRVDVAAGTGLTAQAVGLLLLTQLVFSIAYPLDVIQGLIAGIFVSGLVAASPVPAPVVSRPSAPAPQYAIR